MGQAAYLVFLVGVVIAVGAHQVGMWSQRLRDGRRGHRVQSYVVEQVTLEGIAKVQIRLEDDRGQVQRHLFPPPYAHALSDDLLRAAARSAPQKTGETA